LICRDVGKPFVLLTLLSVLRSPVPDGGHGVPGYDYVRPLRTGFGRAPLGEPVMAGSFAAYDHGQLLTAKAAAPFAFISHFIGLLVWGYGVFWWFFAILTICYTLHTQPGGWKSRFTMSVWSVVFPWGTFTNSAVEFGRLMDSPVFDVFSTALLLLLVLMWVIIQLLTLKGIVTGRVLGLDHGWGKPYDDRRPAIIKEA
ncbi:hypothetical protein N7501_009076, partial [Penicillium viridicatum]